jgi:hypothetical protein
MVERDVRAAPGRNRQRDADDARLHGIEARGFHVEGRDVGLVDGVEPARERIFSSTVSRTISEGAQARRSASDRSTHPTDGPAASVAARFAISPGGIGHARPCPRCPSATA